MSLLQNIENDFKNALKNKEEVKLSTLRMLKSALHNKEIEERKEVLDEQEIISIIQKELKKRQDSITAYKTANRQELVAREEQEAEILATYLPAMMSAEEVAKIVDEVMVSGQDNFGLIMKDVMAKTKGRADGQVVQALVKQKLGS